MSDLVTSFFTSSDLPQTDGLVASSVEAHSTNNSVVHSVLDAIQDASVAYVVSDIVRATVGEPAGFLAGAVAGHFWSDLSHPHGHGYQEGSTNIHIGSYYSDAS